MKYLSRNNINERNKNINPICERFSFRKIASGALISAAIGAFFLMQNPQNVQAASLVPKQTQVPAVSQSKVAAVHNTADKQKTVQDNQIAPEQPSINLNANNFGSTSNETQMQITINWSVHTGDHGQVNIPYDSNFWAGVSAVPIQDNFGNIQTSTSTKNNQTMATIDYNFTHAGVIKTEIDLNKNNAAVAQPTPMTNIGTTNWQINWSFNNQSQTPVTYTTNIMPQWSPGISRLVPNSQVSAVAPNTSTTYLFKVSESDGLDNSDDYTADLVNSAVNYGTIITIPVPKYFVLSESETKAANNFADSNDQTTITQPGGIGTPIVINAPKGSGDQWSNNDQNQGYFLVGQYELTQPQNNETLGSTGSIQIVQKLNDEGTVTKTTAGENIPSFSETILGKNNQDNKPVQGQLVANAGNAYLNNQLVNTNQELVLNYFGFTNETSAPITDGIINLTFAPGLLINQIKTPAGATLPQTMQYQYVLTLANGKTIVGSINAGQSVQTTDSSIMSAVFKPNYISLSGQTAALPSNTVYAKQNMNAAVFICLGKLADNLKIGDSLTSKITFTGNGKSVTQSTTQEIAQKTSAIGLFTYQNPTNGEGMEADSDNAGYLSIYSAGNPFINSPYIYEPIFYYVLPEVNVANVNPAGEIVTNLNSNNDQTAIPKVSVFLVGNREVVKIDYTNTKFNFNALSSACNEVGLNNLPIATNGEYPYDLYVISNTTKLLNSEYGQTKNFSQNSTTDAFNPAWVQNNLNNLYYVGSGLWQINQASGSYVATAGQGNENLLPNKNGRSYALGSNAMNFDVSIVNTATHTLQNCLVIANLPQIGQYDSQFNFTMTGPAYFKALNNAYNGKLSFSYSNELTDLEHGRPDLNEFVSANEINKIGGWQNVKSVAVNAGNVPGQAVIGRIVLPGMDKNLVNDIGKTGYEVTGMYVDGFAPFIPNQQNWAHIQIVDTPLNIEQPQPQPQPQDATLTIEYVNVDNNQVVASPGQKSFSGTDGTKINFTSSDFKIPQGYQAVSLPTSYTFTNQPSQTLNIEVEAQTGYKMITQQVTRIINYYDKETGKALTALAPKQVQSVTKYICQVLDDATNKVVGYNTTGSFNASGQYVPSRQNGQVKVDTTDALQAGIFNKDADFWSAVTYPNLTKDGYGQPEVLTKGNKFEAATGLAGVQVTDDTVDEVYNIYYPKQIKPMPKPNETSQVETKVITRIIETTQNGKVKILAKQQAVFIRTKITNTATGTATYTPWSNNGAIVFDSVNVAKKGFTATAIVDDKAYDLINQTVPQVIAVATQSNKPDTLSQDQVIVISYSANSSPDQGENGGNGGNGNPATTPGNPSGTNQTTPSDQNSNQPALAPNKPSIKPDTSIDKNHEDLDETSKLNSERVDGQLDGKALVYGNSNAKLYAKENNAPVNTNMRHTKLPQTSNKQNTFMLLLGSVFGLLGGLLFAIFKSKNKN